MVAGMVIRENGEARGGSMATSQAIDNDRTSEIMIFAPHQGRRR
jgi:hypothetical protein